MFKFLKRFSCFLGSGLLLLYSGDSPAISYSTNYITSWSECDCAGNALNYTDDQISYFRQKMDDHGHTLLRSYMNTGVWAGDLVEDRLGGEDYRFSDDGDMYVFSGHGSAPEDGQGQYFSAPFCKKGASSSCRFSSRSAFWGERAGYYATPYSGSLRYVMWLTCFSVHTEPHEQWINTAEYGLDYIMGYRDLSSDSSFTDEVAGDWVGEAFGDSEDFKAAWFWAIEDWWIDDTGAVWAPGYSTEQAIRRRDNFDKGWNRRQDDLASYCSAWSWHEG